MELVIQHLASGPEDVRILDVGTGSGVIAITLALEFPRAAVWATEVSIEALSLAGENAIRHSVQVNFHHANLFPAVDERFDCIVANLPYIISEELADLQREVQHDPPAALDGGPDGLFHIRSLIESAPEHLTPSGSLALELGQGQAKVVSSELADSWLPRGSHVERLPGNRAFHHCLASAENLTITLADEVKLSRQGIVESLSS